MEFETNKPTTAQDIALADAHRVTLQPINTVAPDLLSSPGIVDPATRRTFSFEAEATNESSSAQHHGLSHHHFALAAGIMIATLFAGIVVAIYLIR